MELEFGPYLIKTAESEKELVESFKLRDEVFNQEFRGLKAKSLDFDRFDFFFDHLIILHKSTNKIIGTYRLNCSSYSDQSYAAVEFDLSVLFNEPGPHLELGRACIHKDYRKGSVISLLWRGIAEYMNRSNAKILFGCSSLKINNGRDAALVYAYFRELGCVVETALCQPTKNYLMPNFDSWLSIFSGELSEQQKEEAVGLIPPLLKSYIKMGAKIACAPAYDRDFDCIDLLTILEKENLSNSLAERLRIIR